MRSGTTPKTVLTEDGAIPLAIPRDRAGTFEPVLVPKNARRLPSPIAHRPSPIARRAHRPSPVALSSRRTPPR